MTRLTGILLGAVLALLPAAGAAAQSTDCPPYQGVVCDGWVTDAASALGDDSGLEARVDQLVTDHGHQIAVVVVSTTGALAPHEFAEELGNAWGVGDANRNDGIVVLVALTERRTEIVTGPGLSLSGLDDVAADGNPYFANGDFNAGVAAILTSLEQRLASPPPEAEDGGGLPRNAVNIAIALGLVAAGGSIALASRRRWRRRVADGRKEAVDDLLARLSPSGDELPTLADYALAVPSEPHNTTTRRALAALEGIAERDAGEDEEALNALWRWGAIRVVDRDRMLTDGAEPLELRASQERAMLEDGVQAAVTEALETPQRSRTEFDVRLGQLADLVAALRPHRVAEARKLASRALADELSTTAVGAAGFTDLGDRLHRAGPALDPDATLTDSITELDAAYESARDKTHRLGALSRQLPKSTARPAVAAALADLDLDVNEALSRFEAVRGDLAAEGDTLERDNLDPAAVAALLLMNHDESNIGEFMEVYRARRSDGFDPAQAVEFALVGLRDRDELERVRAESARLGLPVSLATALMRRRDDGVEVYLGILDELGGHLDKSDTRRTVAGVLALSLEPSRAVDRWRQALAALEALGMEGSYAEVAAAFGASDARGPREFALAYAATRQAMARTDLDEQADRFAPELAHEGTADQRDTWTGDPISGDYGAFDPFTFFYYHWVITRGDSGSLGWEATYRDPSWSDDRSSWWGGGGGFGSSGSSWGGSSWGSSDGFDFGGFGGGGFGGGSSGGSGW